MSLASDRVTGESDLFVADLGDFGDGAVEVGLLHQSRYVYS